MEDKKSKSLSAMTGIFGVGAIILSIILFSSDNAGEVFKTAVTALIQLDLGLLLIVFGIKENRTKGNRKGNPYLYVGAASLISTVYFFYVIFYKMFL